MGLPTIKARQRRPQVPNPYHNDRLPNTASLLKPPHYFIYA